VETQNSAWQFNLERSYEIIGQVISAMGRSGEAIESLRKALGVAEQLAAPDSGNAKLQSYLGRILGELGLLGDDPQQRLARASKIMRQLDAEGKLEGSDRVLLTRIQKAMADLKK